MPGTQPRTGLLVADLTLAHSRQSSEAAELRWRAEHSFALQEAGHGLRKKKLAEQHLRVSRQVSGAEWGAVCAWVSLPGLPQLVAQANALAQ